MTRRDAMTVTDRSGHPVDPPPTRAWWTRLLPGASTSPALHMVERNVVAWRGMWLIFVSVLVEPIFFLFSIGVGVGALVGDVTLPSGEVVPYRTFVAAGLLATSAMMGPVFDSTFNFFVKLKYFHLYDATLSTPMRPRDVVTGELLWSLLRAALYAVAFLATMAVMGLTSSWWSLLCVPVAILIGFAFAGAGLGATTFMRSFIDFDFVNLAIIPMFLFSGVFFPVSRYPDGLQWVVRATPLYQGVVLERSLVLGTVGPELLVPVIYLAVMGTVGLQVAGRRLNRLLLR
jgi:lipooligosaccharide transport system permease protein